MQNKEKSKIFVNHAITGHQSLEELWVSIRDLADNRVNDNRLSEEYPLDTRVAQVASLKSLVNVLEMTHESARLELRREQGGGAKKTPDELFEAFDFEAECKGVVTESGTWEIDASGSLQEKRVFLDDIETGRPMRGTFTVDYRIDKNGVASFEIA